jgi:prepilin-type N-terminal cleavage/methylation domain-containing protein
MRWQKGFSLIELLIVVAVIGVVSSIAIPSYISSRRAAKESAAISNVRTLISAQGGFLSSVGGYSRYASLSELTTQGLIESTFVNNGGVKDGYLFQITQPDSTSYIVTAEPHPATSPERPLMRFFYADESGVIRQSTGAAATISSPPVSGN